MLKLVIKVALIGVICVGIYHVIANNNTRKLYREKTARRRYKRSRRIKEKFSLRSNSFKNNGWIAEKYTRARAGANISPELHWEYPPEGTKSFVLIVIDLNPVMEKKVHWMVINIPPGCRSLSEGASYQNMPLGSRQLKNSYAQDNWNGPQPPPKSGLHIYEFTAISGQRCQTKTSEYRSLVSWTLVGEVRL